MFSTGVTTVDSVVDSFDEVSFVDAFVVSVDAVSTSFVFALVCVTRADSCVVVALLCEAPQPTRSEVPRTEPRSAASTEG